MQEVIRLRQAQQEADDEIRSLSDRVDMTEQRQQQMVAFFAQALQHPALVQHFVSASPSIKRLEDGRRRKKRRGTDGGGGGSDSEGSDAADGAADDAALVVRNSSASGPAQGLADLASAFMQLLNTHSEPPKRTAPKPRPSSARPIIEEAPASYTASMPAIPSIPGGGIGGGATMVIGSTPADPAASAFAALTDDSFRNALGDDDGPIVELPGLPSLNLDDLDMDRLPDMDVLGSLPSQDLLITDEELARLNEHWNSAVHPPAGQTAFPGEEGDSGV